MTLERTAEDFSRLLLTNLTHYRGQALGSASRHDLHHALALSVRNFLMLRYRQTNEAIEKHDPKFVYYLSAEYLLGRQLPQNLFYTGLEELAAEVLAGFGLDLAGMIEIDTEPGLGNGGLGRLAACFLDSLATLRVPSVGYGIRYEFGIFKQSFEDGWQKENPDNWLHFGNPWEFPHPDDMVLVGFGGHTEHGENANGELRVTWHPAEQVFGEPCHMLVPGYGNDHINILRLWRARATEGFDFRLFDSGDYLRAVERKVLSENLTKVLYPNDSTEQGQELRLRQQYFFVACSLHDILRRFRLRGEDLRELPTKAAIQLNDTHPAVAIPELMRVLMDEQSLGWDTAWDICQRCFAYTCHTLMPEALETWPVELFRRLLPRHLEILYEINARFLASPEMDGSDDEKRRRMSLIDETRGRRVRMANLATIGSHSINGVAELQSRLLREHTLRDFAEIWPKRFHNKTNGVTPRRFMRLANKELSELITGRIGAGWLKDLEELRGLEEHAADPRFREEWRAIKRRNKEALAARTQELIGLELEPDSMFDIMVKRLHEYKRQHLKALHIITLYRRIKADPQLDLQPTSFVFGAKAAPGYTAAKRIIKLIHEIGRVVHADPDVAGRLRVAFLPNFNVSLAEQIYPAADLSEQISMAGKEASGTGNMKFALNGALTIGTLDGANIEIRDLIGAENFFLFGLDVHEALARKSAGYHPGPHIAEDTELAGALDAIERGELSEGDREIFAPLVQDLRHHDPYLLCADYRSYVDTWDRAASAYRDPETWTRRAILSVARCGFFSSDRSMREYCAEVWDASPLPVHEDRDDEA